MRERRLMERIALLEDGETRAQQTRAEILIESIRNHLQRILNTRQGSAPIDPDFGIPDFTNLAGTFTTGTTREIMDHLTAMITRYEPRLKHPSLSLAELPGEVLALGFSLDGHIEVDEREIPIRLATRISSSGRITLQRT